MLVLMRRPGETVHIGEEITVTVLGVVGNQVRFGIDAPRSIVIDREEIRERKKRAAELAGGSADSEDESHNVIPEVGEDESAPAQDAAL